MKPLGTILPNAKTLAMADAHADRQSRARESRGDAQLAGCEKRVIGGEVRWYDTTDQYAVVARSGRILWFAVTPNGDVQL